MKTKIPTIEKILKKHNYTMQNIRYYRKHNFVNGCGRKGGFNFTKKLKYFHNYLSEKANSCLADLRIICDLHDLGWYYAKTFRDILKANNQFIIDLNNILHWTSPLRRFCIAGITYIGITFFGIIYYLKNR